MRAAVFSEYGSPDVLRISDVETPDPKDSEVLVRVRAASVNPLDWHFMRGTPYVGRIAFGLRRPKSPRLGVDLAGEVEAIGANVTQFQPGDAVFGTCDGAFAEYVCAAESSLVEKPDGISFEQAAAIPVAALTALQGLRDKAKIRRDQSVLINGAAGGVGTFAVQIAKSLGAVVTAVCSTPNVDLVRSLGADRVIDYTREDFTRSSERHDVLFDCVSNHSLLASRRVLKRNGLYLFVGGANGKWVDPIPRLLRGALLSRVVSQRFAPMLARRNQEDLAVMRDLIQSGKVTPVVGRRYELGEVARAVAYVEEGHARGKVVISVA